MFSSKPDDIQAALNALLSSEASGITISCDLIRQVAAQKSVLYPTLQLAYLNWKQERIPDDSSDSDSL